MTMMLKMGPMLVSVFVALLTHNVASQTYTVSESYGTNFAVSIEMDSTTTTVGMSGKSGRWLGIGFGSTRMTNTYAVLYGRKSSNSDPLELWEQKLAHDAAGTEISNACNSGTETCARLLNVTDDGTTITVYFERDNTPDTSNSNVYTFSSQTFSIIWGIGKPSTTLYSEHAQKGSDSLTLESTTSSTGDSTGSGSGSGSGYYTFTQTVSSLDMSLTLTENSTHMTFELSGPSDRWFGVNWGGHFGGDALIYTTGTSSENQDLSAYDCHLEDQDQSTSTGNGIDTTQNWDIISITEGSSSVTIIATRLLESTDSSDESFSYPPNTEIYYFAHGTTSNDYELAYHSSNHESYEINLELGTSTLSEQTEFTTDQHALYMFLAFGVIMPWSALINRFLGFSFCMNIKCLRQFGYLSNQIHRAMMIIAYVFAIWGFITKWADASSIMFDTTHDILGLIAIIQFTILIFGMLYAQLKLKMIYPIHTGKGDTKATNGHRIFGTLFIVYGFFVLLTGMALGYGQGSTRFTLLIVYIIGLFIVYCILEFYGCTNKDSMNKSLVFDNSSNDPSLPITFNTDNIQTMLEGTTSNAAISDVPSEGNYSTHTSNGTANGDVAIGTSTDRGDDNDNDDGSDGNELMANNNETNQ